MFLQPVAGHLWLMVSEVHSNQNGHVDAGNTQAHSETHSL